MMIPDTITADPPVALQKPIEAILSDEVDDINLFNVYLEFILYRTRTDAESYRKAFVEAGSNEVKDVLSSMVKRKYEMFDALISRRKRGHNDWFASAFDNTTRYSTVDFIVDTGFIPFKSLIDASHFAYRKEYDSLRLFETVGRSRLNAALRTLLEDAVEYQRRHILHLDAMLSIKKNDGTPAIAVSARITDQRRTESEIFITNHDGISFAR